MSVNLVFIKANPSKELVKMNNGKHFQAPESQRKRIGVFLLVKTEWSMRSEIRIHSNKTCRCYLYCSKEGEKNVGEEGINIHAVYPRRT